MKVDRTSILDIDMSTPNSSQTYIEAVDVLDYSVKPLADLGLLLRKLRYGGKLIVENNNPRGIAIDIMNGEIHKSEIISSLFYNGRKSTTFVDEVVGFVESQGFSVTAKVITNHKYSLTIERPNVESNSL